MIETLLIYVWPTLVAITFHEAAHGFVALACGDPTAKTMGRVTLNPLKHIDPIGTILLPLLLFLTKAPFLFGYAKPVPVQFERLRSPRVDMIWVALAGPAMNLILAFLSMIGLYALWMVPIDWQDTFQKMLVFSASINILLAVFNLIPIPPLDGSRVAMGVLPPRLAASFARLEPYGFLILLGALFLPGLLHLHINPLSWYLQHSSTWIMGLLATWLGFA